MELKIKFLNLSAGRPVIVLNKNTAEKLNAHVDDRIEIKSKNSKIIAVLDLAMGMFSEEEIGVSTEVIEHIKAKKGSKVEVSLSLKPDSIEYISKKLKNKELGKKEIRQIIEDIVKNALTESEIAYFVSGVYNNGMSMKEIFYLTEAIVKTGKTLGIKKKIADKHSIGGLPGNRTTPIIVSICSEAGLIIPKTSSRAITSAAGTTDVMETLCKVDFTIGGLRKIVNKIGACFVWGGALGLAPADDKLIQVERLLNLDPEAQLLASIMSKKIAIGSSYVLIDIPYGKTAKVSKTRAHELKRKFERLAKHFHIKIKCILSEGNQPVGNGIGPVLEMRDVLSVLRGEGPQDLRKKALLLSGELLELAEKAKKGKGVEAAKEILDSGKAYKKFEEIIEAQQGKLRLLEPGKYNFTIRSKRSGKIKEINNYDLAFIARAAGCPVDKKAGLYLWKHLQEQVKTNDKIITVYAESKDKLKKAVYLFKKKKPIKF